LNEVTLNGPVPIGMLLASVQVGAAADAFGELGGLQDLACGATNET
jgi:hypothetical protein